LLTAARRAIYGDHLLAEDQSALARADGGGRHCQPGCRIEFGGGPGLRDNNRDLALTRVLQNAQQKYLAGRPHRQQLSISGIAGTNPWLLTPFNS
jgi:hypothetical protein